MLLPLDEHFFVVSTLFYRISYNVIQVRKITWYLLSLCEAANNRNQWQSIHWLFPLWFDLLQCLLLHVLQCLLLQNLWLDMLWSQDKTKWLGAPRASIPSYSVPIPPNAKLPLPPPMKQETWSHLFFRLICPVTGAAPSWAFRARKTNHLPVLLAAKATNFSMCDKTAGVFRPL